MVVILGQQYNVGEKLIVILLYTYYIINRHPGTTDKNRNNVIIKQGVVIIYCYIGCKYKTST